MSENLAEYHRKYYQEHKEEFKVRGRSYYLSNREKMIRMAGIRKKDNRAYVTEKEQARKHGLAIEDVRAMRHAQGDRCAICEEMTQLQVDHDHESGRVRGMLCGSCNRGIGLLKDDPNALRRAARYIAGGER